MKVGFVMKGGVVYKGPSERPAEVLSTSIAGDRRTQRSWSCCSLVGSCSEQRSVAQRASRRGRTSTTSRGSGT